MLLLKNTDFHVYNDIPNLLYNSRKGQMKKLQKAREKGFNATLVKLTPTNCLSIESTLPLVNQ